MRARLFSEAPCPNPGWRRGQADVVWQNPRFGTITQLSIVDERERPLYDIPAWSEPVGAIVVGTDEAGRLAFVRQRRPVAAEPGLCLEGSPLDTERLGSTSLELPRGFPEAGESLEDCGLREAQEETGLRASSPTIIGYCNANTSLFVNSISVCHVRLGQPLRSLREDATERISAVVFLTLGEALERVRLGEVFCGLTKAGLLQWIAHLQAVPR